MTARRLRLFVVASTTAVIALVVVLVLPLAGQGGPDARHRAHETRPGGRAGSGGASGGGHGTTAATASGGDLPPAPAGFSGQLNAIYGQIRAAITTLGVPTTGAGAVGGLPTRAAFDQMIHKLRAKDLSVLYAGTAKNSGWPSLSTTLRQLDLDAVAHAGAAASAFSTPSTGTSARSAPPAQTTTQTSATAPATSASPGQPQQAHTTETAGSSTFPPTSPSGPFPPPPAAYAPNPPVAVTNVVPPTCPAPAPGPNFGAAATYSAQVSADIINETVAGLPSTLGVIVAGSPATFPNPARIALMVVADADNILLDTVTYLDNVSADCLADQADQVSANLDNTTLNTYALLSVMESTLNQVESSVNTVSGQVHVVQQSMDDQLRLTIEQDLAAPASSTPDIALELPASAGGNLDSTPIGVKAIVTAAVANLGGAGEAMNPAASQYLAMANAALAAGNYVQAYDDFHTAYVEAVG